MTLDFDGRLVVVTGAAMGFGRAATAGGIAAVEREAGRPIDILVNNSGGMMGQHLGEAQDIADATLFLASDLAGFVSGQLLPVTGGSF